MTTHQTLQPRLRPEDTSRSVRLLVAFASNDGHGLGVVFEELQADEREGAVVGVILALLHYAITVSELGPQVLRIEPDEDEQDQA